MNYKGDQAALMLALRQVAQAQGHTRCSPTSGNPELRSLSAVLAATGLRIAVRRIEKRAA
jgi:DNA-binding phage protein